MNSLPMFSYVLRKDLSLERKISHCALLNNHPLQTEFRFRQGACEIHSHQKTEGEKKQP